MQIPPLARSIGAAERSLQALLERELSKSGLSFAEWIALVFTSATPLSAEQLVQRQLSGHVVSNAAQSKQAIDKLVSAGFLSKDKVNLLCHSVSGQATFKKLSTAVEGITHALFGDLSQVNLEVTHKTLLEIGSRANALLALSADA